MCGKNNQHNMLEKPTHTRACTGESEAERALCKTADPQTRRPSSIIWCCHTRTHTHTHTHRKGGDIFGMRLGQISTQAPPKVCAKVHKGRHFKGAK